MLGPSAVLALDGRLLLPDGVPAAGYEVSVVGRSLSVPVDGEGRFRIDPAPPLPFRLVAISPAGELSPPLDVEALPETVLELTLPPAFRESVTVTLGVAPGIDSPPAAATVMISQEDLEQRRPDRLIEALEGVAGISSTDQTTTGVPVIRGLARGRTLILLDGGRVTAERRAGPSASFLDPFTLGSVEVSRGPGSVAYGSDAFGGVINARSRYPEPGQGRALRFQLDKVFGGSDEESVGLEAATDLWGGALLGQLTWRQGDEGEAGGGETIDLSSFEDRGGALRYSRQTRLGYLRAGFSAADAEDVGKPASDSNVTRTVYPKETSRRFHLSLDTGPLGSWDSLEMGLFYGRYRLVLDRDRVATPTSTRLIERSDVDSNDGSVRAVASRNAFGGRLQLGFETASRFGLEALAGRFTFDAAGAPAARQTTVAIDDARQVDTGLFAAFDRPVAPAAARASVSVGLRGDRVETKNEGGFFGDRATEHSDLSGHAAVTFGPFANLITTLQVARGFRDPTLSDRYFRGPSGRGFVTGNPDLEPETSLQYDAAVLWAVGRGSVGLYGYLYRIDDLVERYRPANDFLFRNRGEAEIRGLELEAQAPLIAGFALELAAAIARGEALDDDSPLADIAPPNVSATLRWAGERGFAFLRGAAFAEDDRPGPAEVARPGYTTMDLGAGWRFLDGLELRVTGRNLADRRYRDGGDEVASLAPGRSYSLGLVGRY
jgi:iron complex outermembrane receptor protein